MTAWAIDLHMHSLHSDGLLTPAELVQRAGAARVAVIALTDHDTMAGYAEAAEAGEAAGVAVIPGVELSVAGEAGTCHLLGYGVEPDHAALGGHLTRQRAARRSWLGRVLVRLADLGITLSAEEVWAECAGDDFVGRPHLARAMLRKGQVKTFRDAFDRFLGEGAPGHVAREPFGVAEAIALVHAAGGLAVLAHPVTLSDDDAALERRIAALAAAGLDGLEVRAAAHSRNRRRFFRALAERYGLLETGGSDFHHPEAGRALGVGAEDKRLRLEAFLPLLERLFGRAPEGVVSCLQRNAGRI